MIIWQRKCPVNVKGVKQTLHQSKSEQTLVSAVDACLRYSQLAAVISTNKKPVMQNSRFQGPNV